MTVEDGGGLTLQGSTTVCPTKASTVDGSVLSMVTWPRVRLGEQEKEKEEQGREDREKEKKTEIEKRRKIK